MVYKKSVVLSSIDNSLKKAVLNIDGKTSNIKGEVKLYNFVEEPMGVLSLGLLVDGKVQKAGLTRVGYMTYSFGTILSSIPNTCTCALISSKNGSAEPLLLGSISGNSDSMEERLIKSLKVLDQRTETDTTRILRDNFVEFDDQEEIETEIDKYIGEDCDNNCKNCSYKQVFYSQKMPEQQIVREQRKSLKTTETDKGEIPNDLKKDITKGRLRVPSANSSINFIDEIGSQIDMLFDKYPVEEVLAEIIPNSKWVKIDYENNQKYYVVGLIYQNDVVQYVCYGIPATWSELPPSDFNEKAQWLPLDLDDPQGEGYWITYQDSNDGELIKVDVV
ncbi:MAG: hypothetical protein PHQ62_03250 [Clostridia bacterium]|nr:hypothetical protein [Clostridia bacterium]